MLLSLLVTRKRITERMKMEERDRAEEGRGAVYGGVYRGVAGALLYVAGQRSG